MKPAVPLLALCLAIAGCSVMPQWRVFQKQVDPKLAEPTAEKIEAERRGAAFIRDLSATPTPDPVAKVAAIHAVAVPLSTSLGEPKKPAGPSDQAAVVAQLQQGLLAEQKKAEQWKAFAKKYAGKELEDTGVNLAGPAGLVGLVAVVALCVAVPPIGYALLRGIPLLWSFFRRTTQAIGEFGQSHPDSGEELAAALSRKMDNAHKRLVKKYVPETDRLPASSTP